MEKEDLLTTTQVTSLQSMGTQQFTESRDPNLGGVTTSGMNPLTVLNAIGKALFFDYNFFYDVDYGTTEAACEAADGAWDSTLSACKTPNSWMIVRYILFWPITISMLFYIAMMIWHSVKWY